MTTTTEPLPPNDHHWKCCCYSTPGNDVGCSCDKVARVKREHTAMLELLGRFTKTLPIDLQGIVVLQAKAWDIIEAAQQP